MKKTIFILIVILLSSCSMSKPELKDYPKTMSELEQKMEYNYDRCLYAQSYSKVDLRCYEILNDNQKVKYLLYYSKLKTDKNLPMIYRKNSDEEMTFDDFFKYVK